MRTVLNKVSALRNLLRNKQPHYVTTVKGALNLRDLTLRPQNITNPAAAAGAQRVYFTLVSSIEGYLRHLKRYPGKSILIPAESHNYEKIYFDAISGDHVSVSPISPDAKEYVVDLDEGERSELDHNP
jgi:hypothetical protein